MIILTKKKLERINKILKERLEFLNNDYQHFSDLLYEAAKEGDEMEKRSCNMVLDQHLGEINGIQYVIRIINEVIN